MKSEYLTTVFNFPFPFMFFYDRNQIFFSELMPLAVIVIAFLAKHTVKDIRSFIVS